MSQYGQQPPYGDAVPPGYGDAGNQQPPYGDAVPPGYGPGYQQPGHPASGYGPQPGYGPPGYPPPGYGGYPAPGMPYGVPLGPPPPNHLARAIVAMLFFWPLAIAAIVKAAQVDGMWSRGDAGGAYASSESARKYANICFIIGAVWAALVLTFAIVFAVTAAHVISQIPPQPAYTGLGQLRTLLAR